MKKLLLPACIFISCSRLFCQDTLPAPGEKIHETRWSVSISYVKPFGKWTTPYNFQEGESYKILSNGVHALWGVKAGLTETINMRRRNTGEVFGIFFSPVQLQSVFYDQQTVYGPAVISKMLAPFLNYELGAAPFYAFDKNGTHMSVYCRLGISALWTKGKVYYERTNFNAPVYAPQYTGNDIYSFSARYSYYALGGVASPGIKIDQGKFSVLIEGSFGLYSGKYSGSFIFHDYYGETTDGSHYFDKENLSRFHGSVSLGMSYSFGK